VRPKKIISLTAMKNMIPITAALLLITLAAQAQNYSIDWYKVAGGGGTSTGGTYQVSGSIGRHDAGGPMTGGNFSLTGGFWALYAVQTPGASLLRIFLTPTNTAVVAWPYPSTGWNLQQNTNLATTNWVQTSLERPFRFLRRRDFNSSKWGAREPPGG
jgi:hypothetical protein